MNILIATGIYPPKTSGPAQYAEKMNHLWSKMGHSVSVRTYTLENKLPTGFRHLWYFIKIIPAVLRADFIFALDTFSVGFPVTIAAKIFQKKIVMRTGGDFLWEGYVERTEDLILLRDFYKTGSDKFSFKERIIFSLTRWTLRNVSVLVFSTKWQRDIFMTPYSLSLVKTLVIENHYEKIGIHNELKNKNFVAGTRPLKWKNIKLLDEVFEDGDIKSNGAMLDKSSAPHGDFLQKISKSYAVVLVSLGDISPHLILDAISLDKPFILTEESGLLDRIRDVSIVVNPKNKQDIKEKVMWLLNEDNYKLQTEKIKNFSFTHTWDDISKEYIDVYNSLK